jgi:hypothetical protein
MCEEGFWNEWMDASLGYLIFVSFESSYFYIVLKFDLRELKILDSVEYKI